MELAPIWRIQGMRLASSAQVKPPTATSAMPVGRSEASLPLAVMAPSTANSTRYIGKGSEPMRVSKTDHHHCRKVLGGAAASVGVGVTVCMLLSPLILLYAALLYTSSSKAAP